MTCHGDSNFAKIVLHISVMWSSWVRGAWRAVSRESLPIQVSTAARGFDTFLKIGVSWAEISVKLSKREVSGFQLNRKACRGK